MRIDLPTFSRCRVLVVGDVMLDRYWHGSTARISPEAPVPVVHIRDTEDRLGGAANVALNIAAVGGNSVLIGYSGFDEAGERLAIRLHEARVQAALIRRKELSTITKLRVISQHQQMIRLDFEDGFDAVDPAHLITTYSAELPTCDVVVLSDYGKGTLHPISDLIRLAREAAKPVLVDPKSKDFRIYRGATIVTPNLTEFEAIVGPCSDEGEIARRGKALLKEHSFDELLVTRGEQGMSLIRSNYPALHLPTQAREVFDVTGAGDTVIAILAAALAAGQEMADAVALANLAAGVVVGRLGTAAVTAPELQRALHAAQNSGRGLVSEEHLRDLVQVAKAHGERVVMMCGQFDVLSAIHVTHVNQAKKLGDRLIVAIRDDAACNSFDRSPAVTLLDQRIEIMSSLAAVDWVVTFSEETPEGLISRVKPDDVVTERGEHLAPLVHAGALDRASLET